MRTFASISNVQIQEDQAFSRGLQSHSIRILTRAEGLAQGPFTSNPWTPIGLAIRVDPHELSCAAPRKVHWLR